jgi:predicted enzyme related to lactoylglutathione lyase
MVGRAAARLAPAARIGAMSERTSYEPGVPSWVDLSSPDTDASLSFYAGLFGWEARSAGPPKETFGYQMFTLRGRAVAGVGPTQDQSQPPAWTSYVSTDDADAAVARAQEAGGNVLFGPVDVLDAGRMAILAHPAGGVIGVWQPGRHTGAELVNEPGALNWNELQTRDVEGAKAYYSEPDDQDFGGMTYTVFKVDGKGIAGAIRTPSQVPDEVPAFWMAYFTVADCDESVAKVQELGGAVLGRPHELEDVGRFAVVADPHGATFGVIAGEPPEE